MTHKKTAVLGFFTHSLRIILAFSLSLASPAAFSTQPQKQKVKAQNSFPAAKHNTRQYFKMLFAQDPLLEEFVNSELPAEAKAPFAGDRKLLDEDPYFMRAQSWVSHTPRERDNQKITDIYVYEEDGAVLIHGQSWAQSLRIDLALHTLADTGDYLIFSLDKDSDLTSDKTYDDQPSEGLFYISKQELFRAAMMRTAAAGGAADRVPVYYFALSGSGWSGDLLSFHWEEADQFVIYNSQDQVPLPIELQDIRDHHSYMKLNLAIAKAMAMPDAKNAFYPFPARGSTAAFGSFLSGVNLDNSSLSVVRFDRSLLDHNILDLIFPKAHADWTQLIDMAILERLWFVGKIVGGAFVGSVALKYSIYREYFKAKHKKEDAEKSAEARKKGIKGILQKMGESKAAQEIKDMFDVYAHMLTTIMKFIPVNAINIIEYLQDRFVTGLAAPKNSLMRKAFDATLGFSRGTMNKLAVNSKTFFLGAIIMGMVVDVPLVAVQLLWVTPFLISRYFSGVDDITDVAGQENDGVFNDANARFVTSEIIRNITGYFVHGAFSYSADQRFIVIDRVNREVDEEMIREGKDPHAKQNQGLRERRFAKAMEKQMDLRGLPGEDEFLFDAMSIALKMSRGSGYSVSGTSTSEDMDGNFLLESGRWGLAKPALNKALKVAKAFNKEHHSSTGDETVRILKELKKRWSYLLAVAKTPASAATGRNYFEEAKQVRKVLTLLSFGGDVKELIPILPNWLKDFTYNEQALIAAARIYNEALYGITQGDKDSLFVTDKTKSRVRTYLDHYSPLQALDRIHELELITHEGPIDRDDPTSLVSQIKDVYEEAGNDIFLGKLAEERALRLVNNALDSKTDTDTYKPKNGDWLARWQKRRAQDRAKTEVEARLAANQEVNYNEVYANELSNSVGLYPKAESEFVRKVREKAESVTETQLKQPNEIAYMGHLNAEGQKDYTAEVYGDNFLTAYRELSVETDENLEAMSSENPGFFQRLRRFLVDEDHEPKRNIWKKVKTAVVNTKPARILNWTLRVSEGLFSNQSNRTGIIHWVDRNIPLAHDLWRNFVKSTKMWPWVMSFGYLVSYYVWQVRYDYAMWGLFIASAFTATAAVQINNRVQQNLGKKPMGGVREKIYYSFWHSWLTYPMFIPMMLWADPVVKWHDRVVNKGILEPAGRFIVDKAEATHKACEAVLNGQWPF